MQTFAYIPFLTPINFFFDWWYLLLVPLCFGIAVIYKAMRMPNLTGFWREVIVMTLLIIAGVIALGALLGLFVLVILPLLPAG